MVLNYHRQLAYTRCCNLIFLLWWLLICSSSSSSSILVNADVDPSLKDSSAFAAFHAKNLGDFDNSHYLNDHVAVYWNVNDALIDVFVASDAKGWIGFGISDAGGMRGADMVIYETETDSIGDYYSMDYVRPQLDDCGNSWTQLKTWMDPTVTNDEFIAFRATRALDTQDSQDWPISPLDADISIVPTIIIAAYGDTPTMQFHGNGNAVRSAVRFHASAAEEGADGKLMSNVDFLRSQADGSIFTKANNYTIPPVESHYESICTNMEDLFAGNGLPSDTDTIHIIGLAHLASLENNGVDTTGLVHHFLIMGIPNRCEDASTYTLRRMLYVWGPGQDAMVFPDDVSLPLGTESGYEALLFELHYTNVDGLSGIKDDTSVELFYVNERRTHDAAVMVIGSAPDIFGIDGTPIPQGQSSHDFTCRSECFPGTMGANPVTIFAEASHMHLNGARFRSTVTNTDTGVITHEGRIDVWDYDQNGIKVFQIEPFEFVPGRDQVNMECHFDTGTKTDVVWGQETRQEMCNTLLYYYPAVSKTYKLGYCGANFFVDPPCDADYVVKIEDTAEGQVFGKSLAVDDGHCPQPQYGCFSSSTTVQVQGRGTVSMKNLKLGDRVLTSINDADDDDSSFETVYSFAHRHEAVEATFVQLQLSYLGKSIHELEMTPEHLLFATKDKLIPAGRVQVGDVILLADGTRATVQLVREMTRSTGVYAPLTGSGQLIVNDKMVVSTFIALGWSSDDVSYHHYHVVSRLVMLPYRVWREYIVGANHEEWHTESGISMYCFLAYSLLQSMGFVAVVATSLFVWRISNTRPSLKQVHS